MPGTGGGDAPAPGRRSFLRLAGALGLGAAGLLATGCSASDREALLDVDPRDVRLDEGVLPRAAPPGPSARELRRRSVRSGSLAALAVLGVAPSDPTADPGAAPALPGVLPGPTGGGADLAAVAGVHQVHADLLAGGTDPTVDRPPTALDPVRVPAEGGPTLPPERRPVAVLQAGVASALRACAEERSAEDADVALALLHARVAAARRAQADALDDALAGAAAGGTRGGAAGAAGPVWPDGAPGPGMVEALQALLAQEHRARWSYAVVQAWAGDREDDAGAARAAATRRSERLAAVLEQLGVQPVGPAATYPTDDAGSPVDGPVTAAALALRLDDAVATAAAGLLAVAVGAPPSDAWGAWVRAAVHRLADAERSRWSWGGAPAPLPGG